MNVRTGVLLTAHFKDTVLRYLAASDIDVNFTGLTSASLATSLDALVEHPYPMAILYKLRKSRV
jgi:hypothetical protein